jgi:hypothetical protein
MYLLLHTQFRPFGMTVGELRVTEDRLLLIEFMRPRAVALVSSYTHLPLQHEAVLGMETCLSGTRRHSGRREFGMNSPTSLQSGIPSSEIVYGPLSRGNQETANPV